MEFLYNKLEANFLLEIFKKNKLASKTLVYMVTYKLYKELIVKSKEYSIEIYNNDVSISILLFVGFENEEFNLIKQKNNYHIISLDNTPQKIEFKKFKSQIKHINLHEWYYTLLSFTKSKFINDLI